eukprot:Protomagalhaensia_wolfi_Nauph_80__639@NODE_1363_length_1564_cov_617_715410_g1055_i0_p1_GENE_NODE_1363_length_1564_cov_617_715410_g1055_i0NODE_1363_length_1564_cov_617_715410_g1055_i0_p1_ORF_typecomplete_len211_score37_48_NODE_1363_length_1564_cov_617_715410_g1055_i06641296
MRLESLLCMLWTVSAKSLWVLPMNCSSIPSCGLEDYKVAVDITPTVLNAVLDCARDVVEGCHLTVFIAQESEKFNGDMATVLPIDINGVDMTLPDHSRVYVTATGLAEDGTKLAGCEPTAGVIEGTQCTEVTESTATLEGALTQLCVKHHCPTPPTTADTSTILYVDPWIDITEPSPAPSAASSANPFMPLTALSMMMLVFETMSLIFHL